MDRFPVARWGRPEPAGGAAPDDDAEPRE